MKSLSRNELKKIGDFTRNCLFQTFIGLSVDADWIASDDDLLGPIFD